MPARPAAIPGFEPPESPWRLRMRLTLLPLDAPLGFALLRLTRENLDRDFARSPLAPFVTRREPPNDRCLRVSIGLRLASSLRKAVGLRRDEAAFIGFLHPAFPEHLSKFFPGLWVHLSRCRALLPTALRSLGKNHSPAGAQDRSGTGH